ncbi:glycoside hydrolase family 28 protein / polygalacturonase [Legionella sainthelensi]|uniref:glycoside hydrolase family 28 protein n=1 Tax=Legionella sainthelensi TaxID=28087 RepID=UPI000F6F55FA|nr:glycosyl hydrolase family 28 protein [Legionella sainthelensi]VEB36339.1 glycoside hydrolase family 28 protein / polygalacturonase [Legionella sainthelensi]
MNKLKPVWAISLLATYICSAHAKGIQVSCNMPVSKANNIECTFFGSGNNLSEQLEKAIDKYQNNLSLVIQPGEYLLKPITIKKHHNITLHLKSGVTLVAVNRKDKSWEKERGLINLIHVNHFRLSGDDSDTSVIDGNGESWWTYKTSKNRPFLLHVNHVENLTIDHLQLKNSPRFHLMIRGGKNVAVHDLRIDAPEDSPNTDGINVGSITKMEINNVIIKNGDDGIAINAINEPSRNIKISNVDLFYGHGVSIGSGVKNTISDLMINNLSFHDASNGLRIKTRCDKKDCSDTKKGIVTNITYSDITMENVKYPIIYDVEYSETGSKSHVVIKNITYQNIYSINSRKEARMFCGKHNQCSSIIFKNVNIDSGMQCQGGSWSKEGKIVNCLKN